MQQSTDLATLQVSGLVNNTLPATLPASPASASLSLLPAIPSPFPFSTSSLLMDNEPDTSPASMIGSTPCLSPKSSPPQPVEFTRHIYATAHRLTEEKFNPNGPFCLFMPGRLTLDGCLQTMYNNFLYDLLLEHEIRWLYAITHSRQVGVFASW